MAFSGKSYFPVFPPIPDTKICVIHTSLYLKLRENQKIEGNVVEVKGEKKKNSHFSFVGREELRISLKRLLIESKAEEAPLPSSEGKNKTVQS